MSHNNIGNNRYKKVMLSVAQQNYSNYHIVFIDDNSDDGNTELTLKYVKESLKFPEEKITFVQNFERKFATYNIVNAAATYCADGDIQLLLDGDD